ncbi:hypothetical protein SAMN05421493_11836 [Pseudobutyrivibrio sp. 49]|uniref:HAD domain-containing protein n=1 Tax=Pseudobutyrivibrio sp. 49 TaxID=1855344 RepID=UPI0008801350|nr:HAD domain-containing protein [Pseudobutyrivibrio sp. 49]SDI56823.1 hypothetical protein SAMN05421493_11836 [Pseudobutyrivibrio sp. 49]
MKKVYVFCDVDGVLNNAHAKGIRNFLLWLDDNNISIFKEFIDYCHKKYGRENTVIVLTSSWRKNNFPDGHDGIENFLKDYLFKSDVVIDDETECLDIWGRGSEIAEYILRHKKEVAHYVVIDDDFAPDFKPLGITSHWVQTSDDPTDGIGGLRKKHLRHLYEKIDKPVTEKDFEKLSRIRRWMKK